MRLLKTLCYAQQLADASFATFVGDLDITLPQTAVLAAVAEHPGLSQAATIDMIEIDRSTVADICRRLARKGWLKRRRKKQDARAYEIEVTEQGGEVLRIALEAAERVERLLRNRVPGVAQLRLETRREQRDTAG